MNSRPGISKEFPILAVSEEGIITILMRHGAFGVAFVTSVADIGGTSKPAAVFFVKVFAMQIAAWTGFTLDVADLDLSTNICVVAFEPFGAEVMGIKEKTFAGMVFGQPVLQDLF